MRERDREREIDNGEKNGEKTKKIMLWLKFKKFFEH